MRRSASDCPAHTGNTVSLKKIKEMIAAAAYTASAPDDISGAGGDGQRLVSLSDIITTAKRCDCSIRSVERAALEQDILPARYERNRWSYSVMDQLCLLEATAAVIGVGGLGSVVAAVLCRSGVGRLILVDGDRFEESNLNRQAFATADGLGEAKVNCARRRLFQINPAVEVTVIPEYIAPESAIFLLEGADLAVDCLDSIQDRFLLEAACREKGIPLVSAAIAGDIGQLTVIYPEDPGLELIYGSNPMKTGTDGMDARPRRSRPDHHLGVLAQTAVCVSALEASEAVKIILGREKTLRGKLLLVDLGKAEFQTIHLY